MGRDDRVLALQTLRITKVSNAVGVDDLWRMRGQREGQHLRDIAHPRPNQQATDPRIVNLGGVELNDRGRQSVNGL